MRIVNSDDCLTDLDCPHPSGLVLLAHDSWQILFDAFLDDR